MVITNTRINEKGEEEIVISDFSSFKELVEKIHKIRRGIYPIHKGDERIFVKKEIKLENRTISYPINFSNTFFVENVELKTVTFNKDIDFTNAIFSKIAQFTGSIFYGINTVFLKTIFKSDALFSNTIFTKNISFFDTIFGEKVIFHNTKFIDINSLTFKTIFYKHASFLNVTFNGKDTSFDKSRFEDKVIFKNCNFNTSLSFKNTTFKNEVDFNKAIFEDITTFNEAIFYGQNIKFNGAKFNDKVTFHHCIFNNNISFENTEFHKLADFYDATFKEPQQFHLTDFLDRVIFSDATFEQEVQFLHCKVNSSSIINFHSTKFEKGLDISRSNFNICKMSFWDVKVDDDGLLGDTLSSEYYKNNFGDNEYPPSVPKKLRESMRFIKNSFYSEGNRIEGSNFEKKELEVYREEIKGIPKQKIKKEKEETTNNLFLIWQYIKIIFSIYKDFSIMIYNYIKSFREKYSKIYIVFILLVMIILLLLFETYENHLWFWLFVPVFIIAMNLEVKRKNIKKAVKENNYIPLVLLYSFKIILLVLAYGLVPNEYNIVETIKSKITNISALNEHNSPIAFGIVIIVALFLTIIFYENDRILLFFNKNSNDFGTNWMVGVNFTILSGLIISTFILFPLWLNDCIYFNPNTDGIGDFLQNLGEIMSITKWDKFHLLGEKPTSWQYIWLYLGRIFIAYGIYQTIQAFRKYGKS